MTYNWSIHESKPIPDEIFKLAEGDSLIARLLINRGVQDYNAGKYYLDLQSVKASSASEIPEMDKAFARICQAIEAREKITIFGDYDVDGTSSVALLYRCFKMIGVSVDYYIPSRHSEGYGLNNKAIETIYNNASTLLITCDCGISNHIEVSFANNIGLDVIVTDHHSIPEITPDSVANCNPKTLPPEHPLHWLPGVGVAYKLAELILDKYISMDCFSDLRNDGTASHREQSAAIQNMSQSENSQERGLRNDEKPSLLDVNEGARSERNNAIENFRTGSDSLLDLVALGMIADLAPLRAENRYLVNIGLKVLARTEKAGLQELMRACGIRTNPDAEHIGFGIAPRINAAGRLADAKEAVELMITENKITAMELAHNLDTSNKERQLLCDETLEESLNIVAEKIDLTKNCIALASKGWNHGVIGIVASRLMDKFYLPVFIMAIEDEITKGSVRGINIPSLDVFEEMKIIQEKTGLFKKFGGHKAAAGFSCEVKNTKALCEAINAHFAVRLANEDLRKPTKIDAALKLSEVSSQLCQRLEKLAPYGFENPQPVFVSGPLSIHGIKDLGRDGKHIKLFLKDETVNRPIEAVIWNRAEEFLDHLRKNRSQGNSQEQSSRSDEVKKTPGKSWSGYLNQKITVAYTPKINEFNGNSFLQLDIRDFKDPNEVPEHFFSRFKQKVA